MKRFLILLFSGFFVLSLFASTSIKGKIIDAGTESPIDFVSVAVFHQESKTVTKSMVSNQNGEFEIPALPKGKYTIRLSYVGYNTLNMPLEYNGDDMNLGVVKLQSNNKQLKEVEVVGQGTTVKFEVDKKVFRWIRILRQQEGLPRKYCKTFLL